MHLTGSIVFYNSQDHEVQQAIRCFLQVRMEKTLYLIDNSPHRTQLHPDTASRITHIYNRANLGFGAGHNIALHQALNNHKSRYHLVFNPDVSFEPQIATELIGFMEDNPDVGLVMPQIRYPDGSLQFLCKLLPTPGDLIGRRFFPFLPACKRQNWIYEMRFADYNQSMDVPFLSGSFMLLRTRAIQEVGMFDERYFLYMEDADLCRRIGERYRTVYYPKVSVTHAYKKASYKQLKLLYQHMRSAVVYFNKWGWLVDRERTRINQQTVKRYFKGQE
jgi:hypothetical protein